MRRRGWPVLLLAVLVPLAGCWDFRGLEGRGFAVMAGVDRLDNGKFRLTVQLHVARPEMQRPGGGGGGATFRIVTGEGDTLRQAFSQARSDVARELDTTLLDTIVIGQRAAADLGDLDWFVRSVRIPETAFVGVARGDAEPVVRAQTPAFGVPAEYALQAFRGTWTRTPAVVRVHSWMMFNRDYFTPLEDPYAPAMTGEKYGLNWDGMAVFRGHVLAGFLDEEAAALFNIVRGERFERSIAARIPGNPPAQASVYIQRARVRRRVTWERGRPVLQVRLGVAGDLRELTELRITDAAQQGKVEAALGQALAGEVTRLIRRLQELGSDPLGFGELARQAAPYRPEVQDREAWQSVYRQAPVAVSTQVRIIATGHTR